MTAIVNVLVAICRPMTATSIVSRDVNVERYLKVVNSWLTSWGWAGLGN